MRRLLGGMCPVSVYRMSAQGREIQHVRVESTRFGHGRRLKASQRRSEQLITRCTPDFADGFRQTCEALNVSISDALLQAAEAWLADVARSAE